MGYMGIINFLKPAGMTSHDAVYMLRRLTGEKRIGHTGTLDPMAVGVLPLCVGNATRIMDYLDLDTKVYRCELALGIETDTWDIWGKLLEDRRDKAAGITQEALSDVLAGFCGEIHQTPPGFSAIRINGKHLYEYARKGQEITAAPRPVSIYKIEMIRYDAETGRALFDIECSKGTYIRSICHDAGAILGCGGTMSFLARKATGVFRIEQAATAEALKEDWESQLLPVDFPLAGLGAIDIPERRIPWYSNGGGLRLNEVEVIRKPRNKEITGHIHVREGLDRTYCVYCGTRFLGTMRYDEETKLFAADKVFCR